MCLADSGFGKSTGIGKIPEIDFKGLNPKETFIISTAVRDLPFANADKDYKLTTPDKLGEGNRIITNNPEEIANTLIALADERSPYKNVVWDDSNYVMQDYYMAHALQGGWECPKKIGAFMAKIFSALDAYKGTDRNIFVLAHKEDIPSGDGRIKAIMKTTGKMTAEFITPEGKMDILLIGKSKWDAANKKVIKQYITNEDEFYSSAKSPIGMLDLYVPNDLGYILEKIKEFKN